MPFTTEQRADLARDIDARLLKSRPTGKTKSGEEILSSYVPGYIAINEANRIFGPHAWSYRVTRLEHVDKTWIAGVLLTVTTPDGERIEREEVGLTSEQRDTEEEEDKACKGALTDALKRALRTFGPAFGNNLYSGSGRSIGAAPGDGGQHRPPPTTTDPETGERRDCPTCGAAMQLRSGTTKTGRPYTAWFCATKCGQKPLWLPDRESPPLSGSDVADADRRIIRHPAAAQPPAEGIPVAPGQPSVARLQNVLTERGFDGFHANQWIPERVRDAGYSRLSDLTPQAWQDLWAEAHRATPPAPEGAR